MIFQRANFFIFFKVFLFNFCLYSSFSGKSPDYLVPDIEERVNIARELFEESYYQAVEKNHFDGTYNNNLVLDVNAFDDPCMHNFILYGLVDWLDGRSDQTSLQLLEKINELYFLEFHKFLSRENIYDLEVTRMVGTFHTLSSFKRQGEDSYCFRTPVTKVMLAISSIDEGGQGFSSKKASVLYVLEEFKKSLLSIYHQLSEEDLWRLGVNQEGIAIFVQTLESHALQPPIAQTRWFSYFVGATVFVLVVTLIVKFVPWKKVGNWVRDNIFYPALDGFSEHHARMFRQGLIYDEVPDPNNPGQTIRVVNPMIAEIPNNVRAALTQPGSNGEPALITQVAQQLRNGLLYREVPVPSSEDPNATMLVPIREIQELPERVQQLLRTAVTQQGPNGEPALTTQAAQQLRDGLLYREIDDPNNPGQRIQVLIPEIQGLPTQIQQTIRTAVTQPGPNGEPALTTQAVQQLRDGLLYREIDDPNNPGQRIRVLIPEIQGLPTQIQQTIRTAVTQPGPNGEPALTTQAAQQLRDGLLYREIDDPNNPGQSVRVLIPEIQGLPEQTRQLMRQALLERGPNNEPPLLIAAGGQIRDGVIYVDPNAPTPQPGRTLAPEIAAIPRQAEALIDRLGNRLTRPGEGQQNPLAAQLVDQAAGALGRNVRGAVRGYIPLGRYIVGEEAQQQVEPQVQQEVPAQPQVEQPAPEQAAPQGQPQQGGGSSWLPSFFRRGS